MFLCTFCDYSFSFISTFLVGLVGFGRVLVASIFRSGIDQIWVPPQQVDTEKVPHGRTGITQT